MVDITITEICRNAGRNQDWYQFKNIEVLCAEDITEARQVLNEYLQHIYNTKRRSMIYQDTISKGTLHVGYVYSGMESDSDGTRYLQAWCSFYDHKTRKHINPRTGAKCYE